MIFSLSKEKLAQIGLAGKSRVSRTLTGFTPPLSSSSISYRFSLRTWQTAIMRMNNASTAAATQYGDQHASISSQKFYFADNHSAGGPST